MIRKALIICFILLFSTVSAADPPRQSVDIAAHKGKVVVVDFWASWCVPCRRSFPWMNRMIETYGEDGLDIIAVNEDNDSADAKPFLSDYPPKFQIVWDSAGAIAEQFELIAMPTSYIYDRNGELVTRHLGFKEGRVDEYEQTLRSLLETNERSDSAASH